MQGRFLPTAVAGKRVKNITVIIVIVIVIIIIIIAFAIFRLA